MIPETGFFVCLSVAAGAGIMLGVVWIVASICFASRWLSEADAALCDCDDCSDAVRDGAALRKDAGRETGDRRREAKAARTAAAITDKRGGESPCASALRPRDTVLTTRPALHRALVGPSTYEGGE